MYSPLLFLTTAFLLFHVSVSTGVVWIRLSSPHLISARIEVSDRVNTSRYGISFDVRLSAHLVKEFVLPMPPISSNSKRPIFDYTVRLLSPISGEPLGEDPFSRRVPLIVNAPWTNASFSYATGLSVSTAIRHECLPSFFGSHCQTFCPSGEKCEIDECPTKKCQNDATCLLDGSSEECTCLPGFFGEFCESRIKETNFFSLIVFLALLLISVIFTVLFVLVFKLIIRKNVSGSKVGSLDKNPISGHSSAQNAFESVANLKTSVAVIISVV